jgi:hypothetical protein
MILLDGVDRDYIELIDNMHDDDFYYTFMGLDKALSYSSIKWLLKSPKWFEFKKRKPDPETQALRDGKLVHAAILEPQKYDQFNFIEVSTKNTKAWKLAVEKYGKANTFTMKEKYMNDRIATAFLQNDACTSYLKGAETEIPELIEINGIPIRGKADIFKPGEYVADVKTTNDGVEWIDLKDGSKKNQFAFTVEKYDYDLQAYLYTYMFEVEDYYWLVIDKTTTDIGVFKASQETLERGKLKLDAALQIYEAFFIDELIDLSQYHKTGEI